MPPPRCPGYYRLEGCLVAGSKPGAGSAGRAGKRTSACLLLPGALAPPLPAPRPRPAPPGLGVRLPVPQLGLRAPRRSLSASSPSSVALGPDQRPHPPPLFFIPLKFVFVLDPALHLTSSSQQGFHLPSTGDALSSLVGLGQMRAEGVLSLGLPPPSPFTNTGSLGAQLRRPCSSTQGAIRVRW